MAFRVKSNRRHPIALQVKFMRMLYPKFSILQRSHFYVEWKGVLKPNSEMQENSIMIKYKLGKFPKVYVPTWTKKSTHRYKDGSLCLYFPDRKNWNGMHLIAKTIIPWTSQWLLFNEFYNITGNFAALEVRH